MQMQMAERRGKRADWVKNGSQQALVKKKHAAAAGAFSWNHSIYGLEQLSRPDGN